jgi:hypothetical protein
MILEVTVLSTVLAHSCVRRGSGEHCFASDLYEPSVITVCGSNKPDLLDSQSLEDALATDFSSIDEIERIFIERAEGNLLVWIATDHPSAKTRERIFSKQFSFMDGFPEISFDFNVISVGPDAVHEVASDAKLVYRK